MRSSIWIADDDTDDIEMVQDALARLGCTREVHTFSNGEQVRDAFLSPHIHNPKYLIVDSRMPKIGGMELVRLLLDRKLMSRLHILIWSGAYSPVEQRFCLTEQLTCRQKPDHFHAVLTLLDQVFTKLSTPPMTVKRTLPAAIMKSNNL